MEEDTEKGIEKWKIKKLIENLESARGNGTSMISLIIHPRDQISRLNKLLSEEFGTASNIKNRVNRQSVLGAITSTQQRLKLYQRVPDNGLVIYCGTIITDEGKEKKVSMDFEPFKQINTSLYLCDNKFHTEALHELLESEEKYGFIIIDGNGTLFGTLSGNTREVVHKFAVDLPKKHGRGGQSALRFARLREEKRHNYIRKVADYSKEFYISTESNQPNVSGLIIAGSADIKQKLYESELLDNRLKAKVIKTIDISYGGENGFNQAIELSSDLLTKVKLVQEKKIIKKFFEEIHLDTGKYVYGAKDTMRIAEMGAVETLIAWENLPVRRIIITNNITEESKTMFLTKEEYEKESVKLSMNEQGEYSVKENQLLLDWLAENYKKFGVSLEIVSEKSQEGAQFCKGFGGMGGILRYKVDEYALVHSDEEYTDDEFGDDDFI